MSTLRRQGASSLLGPGPLWVPGSCIPRHSGAETSGAPASLPWLTPDRTEPTFTARPALPQPPRTPAWRQGERGSRQLWGSQWAVLAPCVLGPAPGARQAGAGVGGSGFLIARAWGLVSSAGCGRALRMPLAPFLASPRRRDRQCPLAGVPGVGPRPGAGLRGGGAHGPHPSGRGSPRPSFLRTSVLNGCGSARCPFRVG